MLILAFVSYNKKWDEMSPSVFSMYKFQVIYWGASFFQKKEKTQWLCLYAFKYNSLLNFQGVPRGKRKNEILKSCVWSNIHQW